jgi:hypothetical protein
MTTKQTNFKFSLSGVTGTPTDFRLRQNVKKRISSILYLENPPQDAVLLKYIGSKEITPTVDLFIGDRSNDMYANSKLITAKDFQFNKQFSVVGQNFIVTQQYILADSENLPLYYRHVLPIDIIPESVKIYDQNYVEVSSQKYKLSVQEERDDLGDITEYTEYNLFNSLESSYNHSTGEYVVYFVQYTDSNNVVITKLLSNELAYTPAQAEDFWSVTPGELKPWAKVFYLDDTGITATVTMPADDISYVRYIDNLRIQVKQPIDFSDTGPWFPRVSDGYFKSGISGINANYWIPEFQNQSFNPIEPYKFAGRVEAFKVTDRLLKLSHEEILEGTMFSYVSIIFELDGTTEYAITTDPDLDGTTYTDFDGKSVVDSDGNLITWSTSDLVSIDKQTGFVNTTFDISDSHKIYASYPYIERYYTVNGLVMNPIVDQSVHRQTRIIYLVPQTAANNNTATYNLAIHYLKVSTSGLIETANSDSTISEVFHTNTKLVNYYGFELQGFVGLHYSRQESTTIVAQFPLITETITPGNNLYVSSTSNFPRSGWLRVLCSDSKFRYMKYTDKEDTCFVLSSSTEECPSFGSIMVDDGVTVSLVNWIDNYTVNTSYTLADEILYMGGTYPSIYKRFFVLGELSLNPPHKIKDLSTIDVRQNGGGIREDKYGEAKLLNPEVQWYNDYSGFNGQIYPGNSVMVIKLPVSLQERFSLTNIKDIVSQSVPVGVLPLIRFYGYEPRIISILPGTLDGSVIVTWEKEGSEFTYDIWWSYSENGPWNIANSYRLVDGASAENTFTISGLSTTKSVFVKVSMKDKYYQWWYSYASYDSIEGGLGLDENPPTPPFGNVGNFTFTIL